jgi:two-component system alkaline phosphatase synthesis response regulator PhoP
MLLTGFSGEEDKVAGLEAGADDYQTKPFASRELLARIGALLRRSKVYTRDGGSDSFVTDALRIDFNQHLAYKADRQVELTPTEFKLLRTLAREPARVFSRDDLLTGVWGYEPGSDTRLVDVHVGRLRKKLQDGGVTEVTIETSRGFGYRLIAAA